MTVVALLAESPRDGETLRERFSPAPLSESEAVDLYTALLADAMITVDRSGGELLVNYAPPEEEESEVDVESRLRAIAADTLGSSDDVRFEVQVGSSESAVVGNTITHLLEREEATTAAVIRPEAPLVFRTMIDSAAMQLRRNDVVLGPALDGEVYYAGFSEPVDFESTLESPAVETLARRGTEAGLAVDFESMQPLLDTSCGFRSFLSLLEARRQADLPVPETTATVVDELGLAIEPGERGLELVRR